MHFHGLGGKQGIMGVFRGYLGGEDFIRKSGRQERVLSAGFTPVEEVIPRRRLIRGKVKKPTTI
jgi:hypothetical protein